MAAGTLAVSGRGQLPFIPRQQDEINSPLIMPTAYATGTLTNVFAIPSNNLVGSLSDYDIQFTAATSTTLGKISLTFPAGFDVSHTINKDFSSSYCVSITASAQTVQCFTNANLPSGTRVVIQLGNITNAFSKSNQISVSTFGNNGALVDGPTKSATFTLTRVTSSMIAGNSVTSSKIADHTITSADIAHGAVSMAVVERQGNTVTVPANNGVNVSRASCLAGEILTGGGYGKGGDLQIHYDNRATSPSQTWEVEATNPTNIDQSLFAYAECATITP